MGRKSARLCMATVVAIAAGAVGGAVASPAGAALGVACPNPASQVFTPWGDYANYSAVPNGGFEGGTSGWTLSGGANVVSGNESFSVGSPSDGYSLSLPAGSSATTPPMCIGVFSGKMRLFTSNAGAASSRLRVQVIYGGGTGGLLGFLGSTLGLSDAGYVGSGAAWQPSPAIAMLGGTLPLLTQYVQFRFTPIDQSGNWRIDDVYLDPLVHY